MKVQVREEPDRMVQVSIPTVMKNHGYSGCAERTSGRSMRCFSYGNRYFHIPGYHRNILVSLHHATDIVVAYGRE